MPDAQGLKVFVSWSGDLAKRVAIDLRDLLPVLFDGVTPWVSDRDIDAGGRSMEEIARQLDETEFGIIVTTRDNQNSQWLNFEAGALSKRFAGSESSRVVPLLVDMESIAELTGPLTQFQAKLLSRQGLEDTLVAVGAARNVTAEVVKRRLMNEWGAFEAALSEAKTQAAKTPSEKPKRGADSMAEETLELVRAIAHNVGYGTGANVDPRRRSDRLNSDLEAALAGHILDVEGVRTCHFTVRPDGITVRIETKPISAGPPFPITTDHKLQLSLMHHLEALIKGSGYGYSVWLEVDGNAIPPF